MSRQPFHERFPARACPVCAGRSVKSLFRQTFTTLSGGSLLEGYDVVVCRACGCGYADRIPPQAQLDALYREMSKYEYQDQGGTESLYDLARLRALAEAITPLLSSSKARVLDIGCSTGRLLSLLKGKGFENLLGLDPSPVCSEAAERLHGIRVLTGAITELGRVLAQEPPFDCVILSGVLEHLRDVPQALACIRERLSGPGLLVIEVPDAANFAAWPDAPFQEFSTEHINFFSQASLRNLLSAQHFDQVCSEQACREQSRGTVMPVVTAAFRKGDGRPQFPLTHDPETEAGLCRYIAASRQVELVVQGRLEDLASQGQSLIVWGVGTHTQHLLAASPLAKANIRAFVDSNPRYHGKQLNGLPILAPHELKGRDEAILISSRVFQSEIEDQVRQKLGLKNPVIKLYNV